MTNTNTLTVAQLEELHAAMHSQEMMDWNYYNDLRNEELASQQV